MQRTLCASNRNNCDIPKVSKAYEVLSKEETRKVYDQYGTAGVKQQKEGGGFGGHGAGFGGHGAGFGSTDPFEMFKEMFGGRRMKIKCEKCGHESFRGHFEDCWGCVFKALGMEMKE